MKYYYEILLSGSKISQEAWQTFFKKLKELLGHFKSYVIQVTLEQHSLHYYLITQVVLEASLNHANFLLKPLDDDKIKTLTTQDAQKHHYQGIRVIRPEQNLVTLITKLSTKRHQFSCLIITYNLQPAKSTVQIVYHKKSQTCIQTIINCNLANFLSIDFNESRQFYYQKFPKILEVKKLLSLLNSGGQNLLEVETFPVASENVYLSHQNYDYYKHSLVIGSSGSGKSKFLSLLIQNISMSQPENLKIILIDPHDTIQDDLALVTDKVIIDFQDEAGSIDLFSNFLDSDNVYVDLMLTLFQSLIKTNYNFYLERLLRFSIYLLTLTDKFNLVNLRKLLLDADFRKELIKISEPVAPTNIITFFLQDFSELKNQHYDQAFAPLITLIDELQMTPVFNQEKLTRNLVDITTQNFLTVFSLNRNLLGEQTVQTIAGLLMQQIFTYATIKSLDTRIIVIIDEVAIIENPILPRFLSELRKYNVFVILAGQYFSQVSPELQDAIFANVNNFYNFRVSEMDARILAENLEIKIKNGEEEPEKALLEKQSLLSTLKNRECLVRIMNDGTLIPIFKARTVDFSPPRLERRRHAEALHKKLKTDVQEYHFIIDTDVNLKELMQNTSSSRRKINHE